MCTWTVRTLQKIPFDDLDIFYVDWFDKYVILFAAKRLICTEGQISDNLICVLKKTNMMMLNTTASIEKVHWFPHQRQVAFTSLKTI